MADIKNFGLKGVASDVQLGKQGPRFKVSGSDVQVRNATDSAYVNISALDPTTAQHVATKAYVDAVATGLDLKDSCRAATTANIGDLATGAPDAIDGVDLAQGNRILVKAQTDPIENGIYVVDTLGTGADGEWSRASDADEDAEVTSGMFTFIEEGTAHGGQGWVLTTADPITVDTTGLNFAQFSDTGRPDELFRDATLDETASQNIGAIVPATAQVQRVKLQITTPYTAGGTIAIDDGTNTYMVAGENDAQLNGIYVAELLGDQVVAATQLKATIAGAPAAGAAKVHVDYKVTY